MPDKDREERLAKAIEQMVQGRTPEDLDDEELKELLRIAEIRLDAAQQAAEGDTEAQNDVLQRLIARLNWGREDTSGQSDEPPTARDSAGAIGSHDEDLEQMDVKELQDVIDLRRQMAEQAASIAETHREAVWQRVQARIQAGLAEERGLFRWPFRRRDREADEFGAALDRMTLGEPLWESKDSKLEELAHLAEIRRAAAATNKASFADQQARVWARIRPRLIARLTRSRRPGVFRHRAALPWRKLAGAGAAVALVLAALGPIPATGLAGHPVVEFARFLGGHVGVSETSAPPAPPPVTEVIESSGITTDEASALLGLPVYEPAFLPAGYQKVFSRYFPEPITAEEGGVLLLAYDNDPLDSQDPIVIYQERASGSNIAVAQGSAQDVRLRAAEVPATYVRGTWQPVGDDITWGNEDAQTIVFDLDGLRTIIHTTDSDLTLTDLMAIAEGLAEQATSSN